MLCANVLIVGRCDVSTAWTHHNESDKLERLGLVHLTYTPISEDDRLASSYTTRECTRAAAEIMIELALYPDSQHAGIIG